MQALFKNGRVDFSGRVEPGKIQLYSSGCEVGAFCFHKIAVQTMDALHVSTRLS